MRNQPERDVDIDDFEQALGRALSQLPVRVRDAEILSRLGGQQIDTIVLLDWIANTSGKLRVTVRRDTSVTSQSYGRIDYWMSGQWNELYAFPGSRLAVELKDGMSGYRDAFTWDTDLIYVCHDIEELVMKADLVLD